MSNLHIIASNGSVEERPFVKEGEVYRLPMEQIPAGTQDIEFHLEEFLAEGGEDGYYVIPTVSEQNRPSGIARFHKRIMNLEASYECSDLPVFGICKNGRAVLAIVKGMSLDYTLVFGCDNNHYYMYPRFHFLGDAPVESPEILLLNLEGKDATWAGLARAYRNYQLSIGACVPLAERGKKYPVVAETTRSIPIRIRHAWKPVPPPVNDQIPGINEPPVHVAITFQRAGEILDRLHAAGVEHADVCLVGWNVGGHDGRFPDVFPPEPLLGTLDDLKALIQKAKDYGYLISGHTNVLDSYTISKRLDKSDYLVDRNGEPHRQGYWGGGQSTWLCPKQAHLHYAIEDLDEFQKLGFRGTWYFDVMSILKPRPCYHKNHPLTRRESGEWRAKTLALAREKIGASASEGEYDFLIGSLDYVLYVHFDVSPKHSELVDEFVPFWFVVYHGIVTYNSFTHTMNSMVKKDKNLFLLNICYGGRPAAYYYAKFLSKGSHWMGNEDLTCATQEELDYGIQQVAWAYQKFATIADLQNVFLDDVTAPAPDQRIAHYANGTKLLCNFADTPALIEGHTVPPHDFVKV